MFLGMTLLIVSTAGVGVIAAQAARISFLDLLWCLRRPAAAGAGMAMGVLGFAPAVELPILPMLLAKTGIGAVLYVFIAALLWHLAGQPHGFEAKVWEKFEELRARFRPAR